MDTLGVTIVLGEASFLRRHGPSGGAEVGNLNITMLLRFRDDAATAQALSPHSSLENHERCLSRPSCIHTDADSGVS